MECQFCYEGCNRRSKVFAMEGKFLACQKYARMSPFTAGFAPNTILTGNGRLKEPTTGIHSFPDIKASDEVKGCKKVIAILLPFFRLSSLRSDFPCEASLMQLRRRRGQ